MKIVVATPTRGKLHPIFMEGLARAAEVLREAGHTLDCVEPAIETCYIARARNLLTWRVLQTDADVVVFLDDDITASPADWLRLVTAPVDFVCGAYRYKMEVEDYPIVIECDELGAPMVSGGTGYMSLSGAPAGFIAMKVKALREMAERYADRAYVDIKYQTDERRTILDLWPTGLENGRWWGEDYGFCNLWKRMERRIWCDPRLTPTHWMFTTDTDGVAFKADVDGWLRRLPPVQPDPEAEEAA